ncbi:hypothetical protein MMC06_005561 [Schaereria dolodes]|nr:hypothetical protein [Schaereria dolodes]
MEELQKKHWQEQRDLQSRITQKRKSATKKTRKGVNDECAELERQLEEKQTAELRRYGGGREVESNGVEKSSISDLVEVTESGESGGLETFVQYIPPSPPRGLSTPFKKPNRQKARIARRAAEQEAAAARAAEEAANLPNLREQERIFMSREFRVRGFKEVEIRSDGHCLYSAIADQLNHYGVDLESEDEATVDQNKGVPQAGYKIVRRMAAQYVSEHPEDFSPFLDEPLDEYIVKIRDTGEWGGQLELSALARAYGVNINVLQGDGKVVNIETGATTAPVIWLAYYRHSFGLGEHYNSLRRSP